MLANISQLESLQSNHGHSTPVSSLAVFNAMPISSLKERVDMAIGLLQDVSSDAERALSAPHEYAGDSPLTRETGRKISAVLRIMEQIVMKSAGM